MTVRVSLNTRRMISTALLVVGIGCLGVYGYSLFYSKFHQAYESWRFDHAREAKHADEEIPAIIITPERRASRSVTSTTNKQRSPRVSEGSVIGRVYVPRLSMSAMVEEGTEDATLLRAVGHVPGTALPGSNGNVAIAGHRDSFFRGLKDLKRNDEIVFDTLNGSYRYIVDQLTVVNPDNTSVLEPTAEKTLTIVTCFPFHYIGPAPRRYIVRARQVSELSKR